MEKLGYVYGKGSIGPALSLYDTGSIPPTNTWTPWPLKGRSLLVTKVVRPITLGLGSLSHWHRFAYPFVFGGHAQFKIYSASSFLNISKLLPACSPFTSRGRRRNTDIVQLSRNMASSCVSYGGDGAMLWCALLRTPEGRVRSLLLPRGGRGSGSPVH